MKQQKSKKQRLFNQLDQQLATNNLIRKTIPQGPRSMLRALCDTLTFCTNNPQILLSQCQQYLQQCLKRQSLPKRLQYFYTNTTLAKEYNQYPDMNGFLKVHLELISQMYSTKIVVYYLSEDLYLNSFIINNNYHKTLSLSRIVNHHDAVYSKEYLDIYNQMSVYLTESITGMYLNKQPIVVNVQPQKIIKRKHKKSLSVCDIQVKDFQYIFKNLPDTKQPVKKAQSIDDDLEQFNLIKECNVFERKGSEFNQKKFDSLSGSGKLHNNHNHQILFTPTHHNHHAYQFTQQSAFTYFNSDFRTIQSQRVLSTHSISPVKTQNKQVIEQLSNKRHYGRLKFFDQNKNYGFIIMDEDSTDIFVHYDDLSKAGITKDFMRSIKHGNIIRFEFSSMDYVGKYNKSRKAVDLLMISNNYVPF